MFIVSLRYIKSLTEIEKHLAAHRSFLDTQYKAGQLIASGPRIPRTGGVIITRTMAREKLDAILAADPFQIEGVAEYEVVEFQPTKMAIGFEAFT